MAQMKRLIEFAEIRFGPNYGEYNFWTIVDEFKSAEAIHKLTYAGKANPPTFNHKHYAGKGIGGTDSE